MKLKPALTVSLLTIAAAFSLNAFAASDTSTDAKPVAQTEQVAATKKIKPHSHQEEKLGMVVKDQDGAQTAGPAKNKPAKTKSNHSHPRDGGKL